VILGALAAALLCVVLLLAELYATSISTLHGGLVALGFRFYAYPDVWRQSKWFVCLGAGVGLLFVLLKTWRARGAESPAAGPTLLKRSLRRGLVALALVVAIAGAALVMTRARCVAAGWMRGETCYCGLPGGYWLGELRQAAEGIPYPTAPDDHATPHNWAVYEFLDIMGHVTVVRKIGADAVPGLVAMLGDPNPSVRQAAVIALARIGPAASAAVPTLLARLDAEATPSVRTNLVDALELIDPETAEQLGRGP
jgi:hypothetical protein